MENQTNRSQATSEGKIPLPNATAVLVLGISSIALCWCQGIIGLVIAIIALVLANKDLALYSNQPERYSESSFNNLKTGRTIAIIGLVLAAVFMFMVIIGLIVLGLNFAIFPWEMMN